MGLDMFLHKRSKKSRKKIGDLSYEDWKSNELAYWRKANAIHNWFVVNVQKGVDDCGEYVVSKEKLQQLLNDCNEILTSVDIDPDGEVIDYIQYKDGKEIVHTVKGRVINNPEVCEDILPSVSGFFFGGTDYDEYYLSSIEDTVQYIENIIENVDFNEYEVVYHSSW